MHDIGRLFDFLIYNWSFRDNAADVLLPWNRNDIIQQEIKGDDIGSTNALSSNDKFYSTARLTVVEKLFLWF